MKKNYENLLKKGSFNALGLSALYAAMGIFMIQVNLLAGGMSVLLSAIFFRDFQDMRQAAKEIGEENAKNKTSN